ncbi:sigma-70 family RNA polymerase sigma factor [Nonomuraea soli]|uniref:RNA polymerase primary sigma factor/RNA polymerase nonessential primary-like sigma factor n=1 Tax=Nonomuraea soli TaxID=1032476 RepID=A0A7W0HNN3_9ACTN|nr:sigma-70 family RNA polymerase sigma factor [Nonomuraea soli]MBA2889975.1 RNA polymerase primary sigma factor/RNA polymerase nonessential primary-like sigma factor [Nonomuraea soli]
MRTKRQDSRDPLDRYLCEIGVIPLLTAEEEVDLARRIEAGVLARKLLDSGVTTGQADLEAVADDGERARSHMIQANLRLVVSVARRHIGQGLPMLDFIQEGNLGLIRAVEKFDYTKGYKFSTYAIWWIKQSIQRGLAGSARTIRLPVHVAEQLARYARIERQLSIRLGREPTVDELAREAGASPEEVNRLRALTQATVSLDVPIGDDGLVLGDLIEDEEEYGPEEIAVTRMAFDDLRRDVHRLPSAEARAVTLRFGLDDGLPKSMRQVADRLGLGPDRARRLIAQALARLREGHQAA